MNKSIITEYSAYFLIFTLALAFLYAFILYRKDKKFKELAKQKIWLMATLRFLSIFIIASLLLSPLLKSLNIKIEKPIVVFAQDNSESIVAGEKDIKLYENNINDFLEKTNKNFILEKYNFGDKIQKKLDFAFEDKYTNISNLITSISDKYYNRNIGALIIASDGIYNQGLNPIYVSKNIQYPVYTIKMGDTTIYNDISIKEIRHNKIAFVGNKFPIEVLMNAQKLKGQTTTLNISYKGKNIFRQKINIDNDNFSKKINLEIEAEKSGVQQYIVGLTTHENEKNVKNNSQIFAIDVVDSKQKILIVANSPHPDIAAMKNAINTNQNFEVNFVTISELKQNVGEYNLIILHQIPSKTNPASKLLSEISKNNIPTLFIFGTQSDFETINKLDNGIQIKHLKNNYDEVLIQQNKDFTLFEIDEDFLKITNKFPPLITPFGDYKISSETKVLFYQKIKTISTNKPLITISPESVNNESKTAFITGEGIWKWRIQNYIQENNTELFDNLINQIVQYLALRINKDRFIVDVPNIIKETNDINFTAEIYNESYELINNEDVTVNITNSEGKVFSYMFSKNNKSYFLEIGIMPVGNYSYSARSKIEDKEVTKNGSFTITEVNIETENTIANHQILYQLANENGGKMYDKSELEELLNELKNNENITPISFSNKELTDFLNFKWIFFLVLSLLSLEWFLRKFFGGY